MTVVMASGLLADLDRKVRCPGKEDAIRFKKRISDWRVSAVTQLSHCILHWGQPESRIAVVMPEHR
jgi:hypothetical protein